jgi:hypothetical protein
MQSNSSPTVWKQVKAVTLTQPVQATLYLSLCSLILWTVYFTTYPPVHDSVHSLRHHTLTVSCH